MPSRRSRVLLLCSVAALLGACAQNAAGDTNNATRIETDQDTIRFIVNGEEQARIDQDGLHVRHGVTSATSRLIDPALPYPPDASGAPTK